MEKANKVVISAALLTSIKLEADSARMKTQVDIQNTVLRSPHNLFLHLQALVQRGFCTVLLILHSSERHRGKPLPVFYTLQNSDPDRRQRSLLQLHSMQI